MNIRKLKLMLTVDLMNVKNNRDLLPQVQDKLDNYSEAMGDFVGHENIHHGALDEAFEKRTLALQYEKLTLDLDVIQNKNNDHQYLSGFNISTNWAA